MPEQWTSFHISRTIPFNYPRGGYVNTVSTEESTPALWFPNFSFTRLFFSNGPSPSTLLIRGLLGSGQTFTSKTWWNYACEAHRSALSAFCPPDSSQGADKKERFLHFRTRRSPELWKRKIARVEMLPPNVAGADLTSWSFQTWLWLWLQAIGCLFYWDMRWVGEASEHGHAGRHNCVCTEWSVAWAASSSPEIRARAGVGRGRWIDGDGWSAPRKGMGGGLLGAGLVCGSRPRCYGGEANWSDGDKWTVSSSSADCFTPFWNSFTHVPSGAVFSEPSARLFPSLSPWFRTCPFFQLCLLTSWPPNYPTRRPFETVSGHVVITFCGLSKTSTFPCMPESFSSTLWVESS